MSTFTGKAAFVLGPRHPAEVPRADNLGAREASANVEETGLAVGAEDGHRMYGHRM